MKKSKSIGFALAVFCSFIVNAQVGINTPNPQATFHVDGGKDNPSSGAPSSTQQMNDIVATNAGNLGIGTTAPSTKLHVVASTVNLNRFTLIDAPLANTSYTALTLRNTSPLATGNYSLIGFNNGGATSGGANWIMGSLRSGATAINGSEEDFYVGNYFGSGLTQRLAIKATTGNVGIGTAAPTNKLHITAASDPLKLEGVSQGVTTTDRLLVIDPTGVVKSINTLGGLSIPNPAVFRLETQQNNFLDTVPAGESQIVPIAIVKNTIPNLTFDATTSTINFPPGSYELMFVYEGVHNVANCTISSYFVDFPLNGSVTRIHSTAAHNQGLTSNHGGAITYATTLPAGQSWQVRLGRGVSGNCTGTGMNLFAGSTQLLVFRIGN